MNTIILDVTNLRPERVRMLQELANPKATFLAAYLSPEGVRLGYALPVVARLKAEAVGELLNAFTGWADKMTAEFVADAARNTDFMAAVDALFNLPPLPPPERLYAIDLGDRLPAGTPWAGVGVNNPVTTTNEVPPPAETPVVAEFKLTGKVREPQTQPAKVVATCKKGRKGGKRR
jgi:hypothetical protein